MFGTAYEVFGNTEPQMSENDFEKMKLEIEVGCAEAACEGMQLNFAQVSLDRAFNMYNHVKNYGIDRTFLSLFNSNGELDNAIGRRFPSCESVDFGGSPYSNMSRTFIAAMEDENEGFFAKIWAFIKKCAASVMNFFKGVWAKITSWFEVSEKKTDELLDEVENSNFSTDLSVNLPAPPDEGILSKGLSMLKAGAEGLMSFAKNGISAFWVWVAKAASWFWDFLKGVFGKGGTLWHPVQAYEETVSKISQADSDNKHGQLHAIIKAGDKAALRKACTRLRANNKLSGNAKKELNAIMASLNGVASAITDLDDDTKAALDKLNDNKATIDAAEKGFKDDGKKNPGIVAKFFMRIFRSCERESKELYQARVQVYTAAKQLFDQIKKQTAGAAKDAANKVNETLTDEQKKAVEDERNKSAVAAGVDKVASGFKKSI